MTINALHHEPGRFGVPGAWDSVSCRLCPHECTIHPGQTGTCGIRRNRGGELLLEQYGRVTHAEAVPSDQLPLYHYKPRTRWLLLGTRGCTMRCPFCNTYRYSQTGAARSQPLSPAEALEKARSLQCGGVSFGINEPAPAHEYVADVFDAARDAGMATHLATGGMWSTAPFREMLARTSAVTFGIKSLEEAFLQTSLGANRSTLLGNIEVALALGVHVEITWLVLPGREELPAALTPLRAIFSNLERQASPLLLLPYSPDFIWATQRPGGGETSLDSLEEVLRSARSEWPGPAYIHHADSPHCSTRCTECGRTLIRRGLTGLLVTTETGEDGAETCPACGTAAPWVG